MTDPRAWGVDTDYTDFRGRVVAPPRATVDAILDVMGAEGVPSAAPVHVVRPDTPFDVEDSAEIAFEDGGSAAPGDLPPRLPLGYHDVVHRDGSTTRLIVSPGRCFLPADLRAWGWAVQVYSLRSRASAGIGDLADLRRVARWAGAHGAGLLLLNPLNATAPGQASPYYPTTRLFLDPLYARVDASAAPAPDADRAAIHRFKLGALERLLARSPADAREGGDLLDDFATFSAIAERHGWSTSTWPPEYLDPRSGAVARYRADHADRVRLHRFAQAVLDRQLADAARDLPLVHDLPVGFDPSGADAWLFSGSVAPQMRVGAPPDEFNPAGQEWGLPPFDPHKLRAARYEPFVATIRAALRHAAGVRIDHVMGLFRLFWIPEGAEARDGAYVRYPARELLDIVALESHRARAFVVGEDLGTVEPVVREEMERRDMLSYRILWFEAADPSTFPEKALAAVTNHDLPTVAGMWSGADVAEQRAIGLRPDEDAAARVRARVATRLGVRDDAPCGDVVRGCYEMLARASSALVIATLEDALEVVSRPNMPGTVDERPNWSRPLPATLEELERDPRPLRLAAILGRGRGRISPRPG